MANAVDAHRVIHALLEIGAVRVDLRHPVKFRSGILSPIYCDNRLLLGHPQHRQLVAGGLAELIRSLSVTIDVVAGTATAGIPHAAWVAERLECPMVYVRPEAKGHGAGKQIEGGDVRGRHVVVVEDLVTTGGSSLGTVQALRDANGNVEHCVAIFSYGYREADEAFRSAKCTVQTLADFDALLDTHPTLTGPEKAELKRWHAAPHNWQPAA